MLKAQVLNMLSLTHACTLAEFSCLRTFQIGKCKKISEYILIILPVRLLTQPFANGEKKTIMLYLWKIHC